ncbi:MAG TPA: zf-HC2 domain-containing protein [Acidobacteriaceae bacterium]|jgi:anti-sigma factor RsiW|nr:zf-HC2 domain-containing protein [Acidobacteriaceae bacterium]
MNRCEIIRGQFSDYLDGNLDGVMMQSVAGHLEVCATCAGDFAALRSMQQSLANLGPMRPPADLALRIRVALSQELAKTPRNRLATWRVRWQNSVAPFLLQAGAGLASSLVLVSTMAFLIGAFAAPEPAAARDEPLNMASSPRFLYSTVEANAGTVSEKGGLVTVEVYVDAEGCVYDYDIVSGPSDPATRADLETLLLSSKFQPAERFGQAVKGVAVLSFSGVSVQG